MRRINLDKVNIGKNVLNVDTQPIKIALINVEGVDEATKQSETEKDQNKSARLDNIINGLDDRESRGNPTRR